MKIPTPKECRENYAKLMKDRREGIFRKCCERIEQLLMDYGASEYGTDVYVSEFSNGGLYTEAADVLREISRFYEATGQWLVEERKIDNAEREDSIVFTFKPRECEQ